MRRRKTTGWILWRNKDDYKFIRMAMDRGITSFTTKLRRSEEDKNHP